MLGAAQYDGRPSPVFEARLAHAVDLYEAGLAPALVVTGGKLPGDRTTEAAVAREYAISRGVPASAIFGEDEAHNTLDSLRAVAAEMEARGLTTAVFVSDPTHMLRVLRIASDLGIEAYGSPTPTSPVQSDLGRRVRATVHELGALAVYFATGGTERRGAAGELTGAAPVRPSGRPQQPVSVNDHVEWPAGRDISRNFPPQSPINPLDCAEAAPILGPSSSPSRDRRRARSAPRAAAAPPSRIVTPDRQRRTGVRELVKQAEEAQFVDLIACERDCRNCSYAAALDCDGNCGVCPHNSYCPCVNPVVARSKTALRLIELRPILLQDLRVRG